MHRVELATAVLLAVAAVATAWASYQSARWHGKQAVAQGTSLAARVESTRASNLANLEAQVDIAIFTQWVNAYAAGNAKLAAFYSDRFRPEFRRAFAAWVATRPRENPHAPPTPFAMPQYQLSAAENANRLDARSETFAQAVKRDIQRADNYLLAVVLFASSLFFAGVSTRLHSTHMRSTVLGLGYVLFLGTVIWIATFPVNVAV